MGNKLRKLFDKEWYDGEIVQQNERHSRILYTDGDEEELSDDEMEEWIEAYESFYGTDGKPVSEQAAAAGLAEPGV